MQNHFIYDVVNALNARGYNLGQYHAHCPICQTTPAEQRKGRKLGFRQGRKGNLVFNCYRGCLYDDIHEHVEDLLKLSGFVDDKPTIYTANVHTETEEELIRKEAVQCIMENSYHGDEYQPVMNYAKRIGLNRVPPNWYYSERILGHEGLNIPEPFKASVVVVSRAHDGECLPIGGQRILINKDGSRATNRAGAKLNKFTFGFIRGNPFKIAMYNEAITKALLVTESAETAGVLHQATQGSEVWATYGVQNFKTIPLVDTAIPITRPIIFFPDKDEYGSRAHAAVQDAINYHSLRGYTIFELYPPEPDGSKNNFADSCARLGLDYVSTYIKAKIDEIKNR